MIGGDSGIAAVQRRRLLAAAALAAREEGVAGVSVSAIVARSGVSRRTFYEHFAGREECLFATLEEALARATARVLPAYRAEGAWRDALRASLLAFLAFLDEEPALGAFLVVDSLGAGDLALERRADVLATVVDAIDHGRGLGRASGKGLSRLTAEGVAGAVLGIVHARLLERGADGTQTMSALLGQLMGIVVLPYLGPAAAAREIAKPTPHPQNSDPTGAANAIGNLGIRVTYRTTLVLSAIAAHPGASNREVSDHAGVADQGQISKLLARLARVGLIENLGAVASRGERYAWRLTPRGSELERTVKGG
ncbi:MAG TPA: TetR family transcriptional regulator [Solirubrobacteraceae bacterium]|jgi:AcrR family transcriptional regulator